MISRGQKHHWWRVFFTWVYSVQDVPVLFWAQMEQVVYLITAKPRVYYQRVL